MSVHKGKAEAKPKEKKPSLQLGPTEAAFKLALDRAKKFVALLVHIIGVHLTHATANRRRLVYAQVTAWRDEVIHVLTASEVAEAIEQLRLAVEADANAEVETTRPKVVKRVVDALSGLGLGIDQTLEFVGKKLAGTAFDGNREVEAEIMNELGFNITNDVAPIQDPLVEG